MNQFPGDGETLYEADRPVGEVPPPLNLKPTVLDQLTGQAHVNGLNVQTVDQWCVCTCIDDVHHRTDLIADARWNDGRYEDHPTWRTNRRDAQRDLFNVTAPTKHIVWRPARVITGPVTEDGAA